MSLIVPQGMMMMMKMINFCSARSQTWVLMHAQQVLYHTEEPCFRFSRQDLVAQAGLELHILPQSQE